MANTKNVILNLPFDESDGSLIAYDYSANRADGCVRCKVCSGKIGKIQFSGKDTCRFLKQY